MNFISHLLFPDVYLIEQEASTDNRGSFLKGFAKLNKLEHFNIEQINYVETINKGVFRGLHYQQGKDAESKLFRALKGAILSVFIDLRPDSNTFLQSGMHTLTSPNKAILIPKGFATGYLTLENDSHVFYLSDNKYIPEAERGIRWDDPLIQVNWPVFPSSISPKDKAWANLNIINNTRRNT